MFHLFGDINLEQTLATLTVLAGVFASYKPIFGLINKKLGLRLTTTGVEVRRLRIDKLADDLHDIYDTELTGKPVDRQIIELEEEKYQEYHRLNGNGFIDKRRTEWLEKTTHTISKIRKAK